MASLAEIERAIREADKAGRTEDVVRLGQEWRRMKQENPSGLVYENPDPVLSGWRFEGPEQFQQRPWYEQAGGALDDTLRLLSNGVTFGFRDKMAPYLGGSDVETERLKTEKAMERAGFAGRMAEATGMSMTPGGPLRAMEELALKGAGGLRSMLGKGSVAATEGATMGALNAAGHDEDIGKGALSGALVGPLARFGVEALSKGAQKIAGLGNKKVKDMTVGDIPPITRSATGRPMMPTPQGGNTFVSDDFVNEMSRRAGTAKYWETKLKQAARKTKTVRGGSEDLNIRRAAEKELEKVEAGKGKAWSPGEAKKLDELASGTTGHNLLTRMANLAPSSNMLYSGMGGGIGFGAGMALNNPHLAAALAAGIPIAGQLSKFAGNQLSRRKGAELSDQIIRGGPKPKPTNAVQDTLKASESPWEKFLRAWAIAGEERRKSR